MKKISLAVGFAIIFCWNSSFAKADQEDVSTEVEIPVKALRTPFSGYEEKNAIQAVLFGVLPNSCYSLGHYQEERNNDNHTIKVRQFAIKQTSGVCADEARLPEYLKMTIPFTKEIQVGKLPSGDYKFVFNLESGRQGTRVMNVSPNKTLKVDSLPYAHVSNISVPDLVDGKDDVQVVISGVLNASCIRLNHVSVENQEDVSILKPTVSIVPGVVCAQVLIPFERQVNLGKVDPGIHLIHARSMNGVAVNKVVQVGG
jgi:hypothetical protein